LDVFGINGGEFLLLLLVVAVLVIGPDRMPEYAAKLAKLVKQLRALADTAKVQLREQIGPDFDDVDWKQYDPRSTTLVGSFGRLSWTRGPMMASREVPSYALAISPRLRRRHSPWPPRPAT